MKIAFLGPHASFTQLAAAQLFPDEELLPQASILDCFNAVENGDAVKAVVPLENSIEGTVSMTLDYLYKTPSVKIEAEAVMPIAHHLMIHPDNAIEDVERIYSHPQALAQSFHFLDTHYKEIPKQDFSSTAAAAKYVSENRESKIAAVANQFAANLYGLKIISRNIQDFEQNHTRFIIISKQQNRYDNSQLETLGEKSGMLITLPEDHPGGLHQVLSVFAWRKMNLSKIESRTLKTGLGNYFFFINVEGPWNEVLHGNALQELESIHANVDFLGNYKEFLLES
ncbi:prephenate dehydratase [Chryseobacterium arthrosphaerae]|uniref:Bifunctional chorismate mutase/prephenate dehydratase n=1 Tax=Chryseobacterium arthrosphaerae TaxID=651561 RepID=A0A1B8ZNS8_9FLAO|nr:prephenate dehydratase [Chryseobacterium arthrosphaerae]MDG4653318.1 prephenate dehydratase [Chryseobacterium arthrosphaerae]OCA73262.1 prephenate dehydratase [Chryseobacterium arthrosphaerae]QUY56857.1 prephenate dehydratase [Chryseobacterium arthrosphaerae]